MVKSGSMGKWMMRCTSSIQINFDASTKRIWNKWFSLLIVYILLHHIYFQIVHLKTINQLIKKNLRNIIWANTDNLRCNNLFDHGIVSKLDC